MSFKAHKFLDDLHLFVHSSGQIGFYIQHVGYEEIIVKHKCLTWKKLEGHFVYQIFTFCLCCPQLEHNITCAINDFKSHFVHVLQAKLREAASLEKHVLLKKLRDALEALRGRVAGKNKDDVEEAIAMVSFCGFS